jgi:rod shape determining protein RodA
MSGISKSIDWITIGLFVACVVVGWFNIYAAVYEPDNPLSIFSAEFYSTNAGKQLERLGAAVVIIVCILALDYKVFETFAYPIYGFAILLLISVFGIGTTINGSHSWIKVGSITIQPAEFAKMATAIALAKYLSVPLVNLNKIRDQANVGFLIAIPPLLIIASNETGSALVFASFLILLYREGLPGIYPAIVLTVIALFICALFFPVMYVLIGLVVLAGLVILAMPRYERRRTSNLVMIGVVVTAMAVFVTAVNFIVNNVLKEHQRNRLKVLVDPNLAPRAEGYHVIQSKIAIGSGGLFGKGYLEGTQTKFDFVPEQSTDFIFCTIGEEWGFVGSVVVFGMLIGLILRILYLADRQRSRFARVYGYGVASILFFHFLVNIGMTIGFMPVIGIPLPFFSFGGSSLWSFTILLFVFIKIDAHRSQMVSRI